MLFELIYIRECSGQRIWVHSKKKEFLQECGGIKEHDLLGNEENICRWSTWKGGKEEIPLGRAFYAKGFVLYPVRSSLGNKIFQIQYDMTRFVIKLTGKAVEDNTGGRDWRLGETSWEAFIIVSSESTHVSLGECSSKISWLNFCNTGCLKHAVKHFLLMRRNLRTL